MPRLWSLNSVHPELRRLMTADDIERIQGETHGHETRWRAALKVPELASLEKLKAQFG